MICATGLNFLMLLGLICKFRMIYYLIPWVLLINKVVEFPVEKGLLSEYLNLNIACYSQVAIFQIALITCNNLLETAGVFWVLQIRTTTYLSTNFGYNFNEMLPWLAFYFLFFYGLQFWINYQDQQVFASKKKLENQTGEFKEILEEFPEGILIYQPSISRSNLAQD